MFWSVGWPLLWAAGFFCNLDILCSGLGIGKFLVIKALDPDWIRILIRIRIDLQPLPLRIRKKLIRIRNTDDMLLVWGLYSYLVHADHQHPYELWIYDAAHKGTVTSRNNDDTNVWWWCFGVVRRRTGTSRRTYGATSRWTIWTSTRPPSSETTTETGV
jgi:hypothetical protein